MGVARKRFHQAYKDAKSGKIGAQYLEDTAEVKAAKERFFKFFQFVLDGMLYKLAPQPGNNVIPEEIADFYIKDALDVAAEKLKFDQLYRDALNGDAASVIAVVALEEAISDNDGNLAAAEKQLDETLDAIATVVEYEYTDSSEETEKESEEEENEEETDYFGDDTDYEGVDSDISNDTDRQEEETDESVYSDDSDVGDDSDDGDDSDVEDDSNVADDLDDLDDYEDDYLDGLDDYEDSGDYEDF